MAEHDPVAGASVEQAKSRGRGWTSASSRPIRAATSAFSLVVLTNNRYFSRLSKKRNGSVAMG